MNRNGDRVKKSVEISGKNGSYNMALNTDIDLVNKENRKIRKRANWKVEGKIRVPIIRAQAEIGLEMNEIL